MRKRILVVLLFINTVYTQTAGSGFTLNQEIELGTVTTGVVNDAYTGIDLDSDGNGEIIVQTGQSSDGKAIIYEWNGSDSYSEVWSVALPVSNASSDQPQRLISVFDTDNDGNAEIFIASSSTIGANAIVFCYEMSSGVLSANNPSTTSKGPDGTGYFQGNARIRAIVTGDSDGDGYGELYVGNAGNTTSLEIWEATGDDTWSKIVLTGAEDDIGQGIMDMAPPADLDGDSNKDDLSIAEQQGKLSIIDCSILEDPVKMAVNNSTNTGSDTYSNIAVYNIDNSGNPEIVISENINDGIQIFEWAGSAYDRDKTDTPLFTTGADIYGLSIQDYDNDDKAEIYFTRNDSVLYYEYGSSSGDFDNPADFSAETIMISGTKNNVYSIVPSQNTGNTLLDGDRFRDFIIGTEGNGTSGWGELFILESQTTDNSLPVRLTDFAVISKDGKVFIRWVTESEIDNLGFILYRQLGRGETDKLDCYLTNPMLKGQGSVTYRSEYHYIDTNVKVGQTYTYRLADVDYYGTETKHDPVSICVKAKGIIMKPSYPNPFNPNTFFKIVVGEPGELRVIVLDILGRQVKTLIHGYKSIGEYTVSWNGKDERGDQMPSGVYFIQMQSGKLDHTQRIVLMR